jgi:hypothetical protein
VSKRKRELKAELARLRYEHSRLLANRSRWRARALRNEARLQAKNAPTTHVEPAGVAKGGEDEE